MSGACEEKAAPELPADRRVTPESLAAYAEPRSRSGFPFGSVVLGTLVAWAALPVWSGVLLVLFSVPHLLDGVGAGFLVLESLQMWGVFVVAVLVYGAVPAALLSIPLGAALVRVLRPVRHPAWHGVAFLALGAGVGSVATIAVPFGGELSLLVPATALASGTGWLAVRRGLVARDAPRVVAPAPAPTGHP